MVELNKVIMIGRLTKDPDLRFTPSGMPVTEFRLAVNHTFRGKDGQEREPEVCFIDVSLFGRTAEVAKQYLNKGREVYVEGRLKFDTWEKDGQRRSKHSLVAERFQFLSGGRGGQDRSEPAPAEPQAQDAAEENRAPVAEEDDLPF